MKTFDVVALGELLVDFTENGISVRGNPVLQANPGGAPCNVLSMLQNLGIIESVENINYRRAIEQEAPTSKSMI